jgi:restriction endonuclease S subunit
MHQIQKCAAGSALMSLNTTHLLEIKIPVPSLEKQEIIASYLKELAEYNDIIEHEKEIVSKISASILEKLMGGE